MVLSLCNVKRVKYAGPTGMLKHRVFQTRKDWPTYRETYWTANTQYRKLESNIPRKELRGLSPNFHIHVSVNDFYNHTIGLLILLQENLWTDPGNKKNCSQTHECENLDWGRTFPFLEIHKWDFRSSVDTQAECTCRQAENIQDRLLAGSRVVT
jgi:hypothetical protein